MRLPLALLCLALSFAARADDEIKPDCASPMNTYEINFCSDQDFAKADAELNVTFKKALEKVSSSTDGKPYDAQGWEAALRASQRAWIAFRDRDCKGLVPMEWSGGTGTTAAVLGCMIEKTETRRKELADRYNAR